VFSIRVYNLSDKWQNLSGHLEGQQHFLPIRVYYEDTDFSGLVYHASYLLWCERARTEFVRLLGLHQKDMFAQKDPKKQRFFVVRRMELDYLKPALMDDQLEVVSRVDELGSASVTLIQEVRRGDTVLFCAKVVIVHMSGEGRPARMDEATREAFLSKES